MFWAFSPPVAVTGAIAAVTPRIAFAFASATAAMLGLLLAAASIAALYDSVDAADLTGFLHQS
jgi:hypothetical protein